MSMADRMSDKAVRREGDKALAAIIAELKNRGHSKIRRLVDEQYHGCNWNLRIGGTDVPLRFEEEVSSSYGGYSFHPQGKIKLRVDWVWVEYTRHVPRRTFKSSAKREHGLDITKVCDHIEMWVAVYNRESGLVSQAETSLDQWAKILKGLRAKYPAGLKRIELEATPKGLQLGGIVGVTDAEAILDALDG